MNEQMAEVLSAPDICYNWSRLCEQNNLILSFKGDFNQDLINSILYIAEDRPQVRESLANIQNRIFGIMVETTQNICKHGKADADTGEAKPGIILVGKTAEAFIVTTGNLIATEDIEPLKAQLDKVKTMSKDELKKLHKEVLLTTELSEKSGAGLGIIGIGRKAETFDYSFTTLDDNTSFYAIEVIVSTSCLVE